MKKISVFIAVLLIVKLGYSQSLPENAKEGWTLKIRQDNINDCIKNAVETYKKNPELTTKFCECSTDKIIQMMTYKESIDLFASSQQKTEVIIYPIVQSCIKEVQRNETLEQLSNSKLADRDTLVNFENSLKIIVPVGLKWNILDRNCIKFFAINQQLQSGNILLGISKFDNTTFKELHSQMINYYSITVEPKSTISNLSEVNCPTPECANYELEMIINGITAKGKTYFFGKKGTYFNAYFVTTGEISEETVNSLKKIIESSILTF